MDSKFLQQLKDYILNNERDNLRLLIPYYETLKQHQGSLKVLDDEVNNWTLDIHFDEDEEGYYTNGKFVVQLWRYVDGNPPSNDWEDNIYREQEYCNYHYEINLENDPRHWGYCMCTPEDYGYRKDKDCCGCGCDWDAPSFTLNKIETVVSGNFDGYERDLWDLEDKWNAEFEDLQDKEKEHRVNYLKDRIAELEEELNSLK